MKSRSLSLITAVALMIFTPMVMACSSCHVEPGVTDYQTTVADIGKIDTPATELKQININSTELISSSVVIVSITAYSKPRSSEGYEGFMKANKLNAGAIANKQAKPHVHLIAG